MYNHSASILVVITLTLGALSVLYCLEADGKLLTLDLKSTDNGDLFYTQVETGSDKNKQSFKLVPATSYSITWLQSTKMSPKRGYRNRTGDEFDAMVNTMSENAFQGLLLCYHVHYDAMRVGSSFIERQPFALTHPCPLSFANTFRPKDLGLDGELGLGNGLSEPRGVKYLFHNLYKQGYIDHLRFSLYINNTAVALNRQSNSEQQRQQPEGALVLGGLNSRYYSGDFQYVSLYQDAHWSRTFTSWLTVSTVHLDWTRVGQEKLTNHIGRLARVQVQKEPNGLTLESNLKLFIGPKNVLNYIHEALIGADKIIRNNFYVFKDCRLDDKPDVVFSLRGGVNLTITPEDYVIEHRLKDKQVCMSAFKPSGLNGWSFGMRFLRKYYTFFDYENQRVGFAKPI